ncbi:hypothetical protein BJ741DRAFT_670144 [Chytriomyces cf. hyalinus JEL632]|nr:hypothetical protein BJ741DRAFT_670144 [Chytriomyces cf. hyalinus JEL632]
MTSTQGLTGRGVGTAGAQIYNGFYSTWYPKYAIYLSGRNAGQTWSFGHRVYGDKDVRPLGGNCYEIVSYYITYSPLIWPTTASVKRTTTLTTSTTLSTASDSQATATVAAPFSTTSAALTTRTASPSELTVASPPSVEGIFTGTVYTDSFDNSTFVVLCGQKQSFPDYSPPWAFVGLGLAASVVGMGLFIWCMIRWQRTFWSTHTASISVGPSRVQQVVVGSTDPQHIAMLQQQQQPIYVTPYNGYGQPANVLSGSYPVYAQPQNSDDMSAPAPAAYANYGQHGQQTYGQQNSMSGNQRMSNVNVLYADPPPASSTSRPDGVERR